MSIEHLRLTKRALIAEGEFSGMHLVATMYTACKQIDPSMDAGVDLDAE